MLNTVACDKKSAFYATSDTGSSWLWEVDSNH